MDWQTGRQTNKHAGGSREKRKSTSCKGFLPHFPHTFFWKWQHVMDSEVIYLPTIYYPITFEVSEICRIWAVVPWKRLLVVYYSIPCPWLPPSWIRVPQGLKFVLQRETSVGKSSSEISNKVSEVFLGCPLHTVFFCPQGPWRLPQEK